MRPPHAASPPAPSSRWRALLHALAERRRGLARVALLAGALLCVEPLLSVWPQTTQLQVELGARHREVTEVRLSYLQGGEPLKGVRYRYRQGAPPSVSHSVSLPGGELQLLCELRGPSGASTSISRTLRTPADGVVRIAAAPTWASAGPADATRAAP